jgi:hypothetical protein
MEWAGRYNRHLSTISTPGHFGAIALHHFDHPGTDEMEVPRLADHGGSELPGAERLHRARPGPVKNRSLSTLEVVGLSVSVIDLVIRGQTRSLV